MQQDTWMSPGLPVQELRRRSLLTLLLFLCPQYRQLTSGLPPWVCTTRVAPRGLSARGLYRKKRGEHSHLPHLSTSSSDKNPTVKDPYMTRM